MKRFISTLLAIIMACSMLPFCSYAAESSVDEIIYLEDGSYIIVIISDEATWSTSAKRTRTYIFCNSDGEEEWRAVLTGIFHYDGTTATATSSVCNVTITDTAWSNTANRGYVSGGSALCDLTMVKKWLGITIQTEELTLSLTCSPTGEFT